MNLQAQLRLGLFIECPMSRLDPIIGILLAIAFLLFTMQASASEIEPRSYINTPVGVNFLLVGYSYLDGNIPTEDSAPIKDAKLAVNTQALSYVRTLDLFGKPAKLAAILPYSQLSGTAMVLGRPQERKISGFNDPRFSLSMNFYGAPVLSPQEFASYQQNLIIGGSIQVSPSLGQYDDEKLVNLGNNCWFARPDIGMSKAWGPVTLELSTGVFFFTKNDDYFGGKTLEQNPISSSQLHITYNFSNGAWITLSGTHDYGGGRIINGISSNDIQNNTRIGATFAVPVNRRNSIKFYASDSLRTTYGVDAYLVGVAWQYRWGNGL
jgi:hypothetical protein